MRLRDIATVAERWVSSIAFATYERATNVKIRDFRKVIAAAEAIRETGALKEAADRVLNITEISKHVHDDATVPQQVFDAFAAAVNDLKLKTEALISAIRSVTPSEEEDQISVKLPDESDLDQIAATLKELNKAFEQAVANGYAHGAVTLLGADRGSIWLEILVGSTLAVRVVGALLRIVCDFQLRQAKTAQELEVVRNLGLQNDAIEAAERTLELRLAASLEADVEQIANEIGAKTEDKEYRQRLQYSIKTLSDLVGRGLEIRPSLTAPEGVRETFPSSRQIASVRAALAGPKRELTEGAAPLT
jgi:hypothetical protein